MPKANDKVLIYAGDGRCYWKQDQHGYTSALYAGVFSREEAIALTKHCGPEKRIEFHPVPEDHIPTLKLQNAAMQEALEKWQAHMKLGAHTQTMTWGEIRADLAACEAATASALALPLLDAAREVAAWREKAELLESLEDCCRQWNCEITFKLAPAGNPSVMVVGIGGGRTRRTVAETLKEFAALRAAKDNAK